MPLEQITIVYCSLYYNIDLASVAILINQSAVIQCRTFQSNGEWSNTALMKGLLFYCYVSHVIEIIWYMFITIKKSVEDKSKVTELEIISFCKVTITYIRQK